MRILVRPCYHDFLQNRLFKFEHVFSAGHWMEPYVRLRKTARANGWEMDTWDMFPLETAEIVFFQDLPRSRRELEDAKKKAPRAKFVLQLLESPLSRPHFFDRRNHDLFDAILTYNPHLCDEKRYFRYFLPIGPVSKEMPNPAFVDRKPLVLINSNRWIGIWGVRQPGKAGLPFIGPMFSGWSVSASQILGQNRGEQYSHRRQLARLADKKFPGLLDIYGSGWRGENMSWTHRFIRHRPFISAKGPFAGDKFEILNKYRFAVTFENVAGDFGYVSEKMLDAIYGGTVPLYIGDEHICDIIPADCFVDARRFRNDTELLSFVQNCPESEWRRLRNAGQKVIESRVLQTFESDAFVQTVIQVLSRVMKV